MSATGRNPLLLFFWILLFILRRTYLIYSLVGFFYIVE